MNQYLNKFSSEINKSTFTTLESYYSHGSNKSFLYFSHKNNKIFDNPRILTGQIDNSDVIIYDGFGMKIDKYVPSVQELLMMSMKANVAITQQCTSIASFIEWFRNSKDYQFGNYSMLKRVKGITFVRSIVVGSERRFINESLVINRSNIEKLLKSNESALSEIIAAEIHSQGGATIADQLLLLRKNPTSTYLEVRTRTNEASPHDWADFSVTRTNSGKHEDKVNLARQNPNDLYPTVSDRTIDFSEIDNFLNVIKNEAKADVYSIGVSYRHGTDLCLADGKRALGLSDDAFHYNPVSGNFDLLARETRNAEDHELLPQLEKLLKLPSVVEAVELANDAARTLGLKVADRITVSIISGIPRDFSIHAEKESEKYPTNPVRHEYKVTPLQDRKKLITDYRVEINDYKIG